MNKSFSDAWGNAIDYYYDYNNKPWLKQNFTKIAYKDGVKIQKGDIVIFKSTSKYGHIAVCNGKYDGYGFQAYDQNFKGTHAPMTLRKFEYDGPYIPLGFLRPKDQSNIIVAPYIKPGTYFLTNVRGIYKGYGAKSGRKKVKEITSDAKIHATSGKSKADAYLKAGTEITIKETKLLDTGNLWAKIPSGYICIWERDIDRLFVK